MYNVQDIEGEQIIMILVDEVHALRLPSKPNVKSFAEGKENTQIGFRYYDVILCYQYLSDSTLTAQQWRQGIINVLLVPILICSPTCRSVPTNV